MIVGCVVVVIVAGGVCGGVDVVSVVGVIVSVGVAVVVAGG